MIIGIDAGGTSTRAVVVDPTGRCLGYGRAGGANPVSRGQQAAARAVAAAASQAATMARNAVAADGVRGTDGPARPSRPGVVVVAMAGGSARSAESGVLTGLRALDGVDHVEIASDLLGMFCSGTSARSGYGLVSGTGAAAVRVEDGRVVDTADGVGWLLGDAGSGFWIGRRVVRAATAAIGHYGPPTSLAAAVLHAAGIEPDSSSGHGTGVAASAGGLLLGGSGAAGGSGGSLLGGRPPELLRLIDHVYGLPPVDVARFAVLAFRAAGVAEVEAAGAEAAAAEAAEVETAGVDPVARAILHDARARLVDTVRAVRRADTTGPVVMGGSIARRLPGLAAAVGTALARNGAAAEVATVADGAVGAAVLALRRWGATVDAAVFDRITGTLAALRD